LILLIVTVAIVVYKGLIPVVGRILTHQFSEAFISKKNRSSEYGKVVSGGRFHFLSFCLPVILVQNGQM
ncbi:hypothetical protein ACJEEM_07255, partial [Phocaeicola plebeius]